MLIDVDRFKQFNDHYGHLEGDQCLRQIGQVLKTSIKRAGDVAARYGGEEMAILLPNTTIDGAKAVADRVMSALRQIGIRHKDSPTRVVTVSCGIHALVPRRGQHIPADIVQAADAALYSAKAAGRDQAVCAMDIPQDRSVIS